MQQFFIDSIDDIKFSKTQLHQIKNVLRMHTGDTMRLVDSKGLGIVVEIKDDNLSDFKVIETIKFKEKNHTLKIIMSLIRNERLEWMIQKATEIGVDEIVLYQADHGVVRDYGNKTDRKLERFNTIALEASEQSYRQYPLVVSKVIDKKNLESEKGSLNFYADVHLKNHIYDRLIPNQDIVALIGPEGGFSEKERQLFKDIGYEPVSLGANVLRAETAPIVLASFVSLLDKE